MRMGIMGITTRKNCSNETKNEKVKTKNEK